MRISNPASGQVIAEVGAWTQDQIEQAFFKAKIAQIDWAKRDVSDRLSVVQKFGDLVQKNSNTLAKVLTLETGKPLQQSINEITGADNRIVHLTANAGKWLASEVMDDGPTREEIHYEPLGVIVNISAWNFPYNVGFNVFLYALVAGNAVVYKPSEFATLTGLEFERLLHDAGLPEHLFHCVVGAGEVGSWLTDLPADGFFFTGSHATGQKIAMKVAERLVPVQLELGGKDPLYVADDVLDVKQAAANGAEGAFYNLGQSCCAVERIYVHEAIYDEFVAAFLVEVDSYKIGDPDSLDTFIGPFTRESQVDFMLGQIEDATSKGAKVLLGGNRLDRSGNYMAPTVLVNVDHTMSLMIDESFGPIVGIQKVSSDGQAVQLMNDTEFGLTSAVFTSNEDRAHAILKQMNSGTVYWNCCDRVSANVPWSGRGKSGLGSTLSYQGIRAFVQPKAWHLRKD